MACSWILLESISIFLNFKDCANVDQLNHMYHCKAWNYVLRNYGRKIYQVIRVDHTSINWINTYKLFLSHQHLLILINVYDLSIIPKVKHLSIVRSAKILRIPVQVTHISLLSFNGTIQKIIGLESLGFYKFDEQEWNMLALHSQTVKNLNINYCTLQFELFPVCSNLETLSCYMCTLIDVDCLFQRCTKLTTLKIVYPQSDITQLKNFPFKLILRLDSLLNTKCFIDFKCQELDLSLYPNIQDYSGVAHIPIVIKK
jgi:hypothetical protein